MYTNYAKTKKDTRLYDLGDELNLETGYVYDYGVYKKSEITTDELMDGFPLLAWATSPILSHYTDLNFPNLINATEVEIGMPRGSFESYFEDFSYEPGFFKDEK